MTTPDTAGDPPVVIVGATATGKSGLAMALADRIFAATGAVAPTRTSAGSGAVEIVSMDSMQVYRGMDIGTAKPSVTDQERVPHHLIDLVAPSETFDLSRFQAECRQVLAGITGRGSRALMVGGTGLYVQAVVDDLELPGRYPQARAQVESEPVTEVLHAQLARLDPVAASRMEPSNRRRVLRALEVTVGSGKPFSSFGPGMDTYPPNRFVQIGLRMDRELLYERIEARYHRQMADGFLSEIRALLDAPGGLGTTAAQALGYKEFLDHLAGRQTLDEALTLAISRTRRFARRQERWFRRDPRITWFDAADPKGLVDAVAAHLELSGERHD